MRLLTKRMTAILLGLAVLAPVAYAKAKTLNAASIVSLPGANARGNLAWGQSGYGAGYITVDTKSKCYVAVATGLVKNQSKKAQSYKDHYSIDGVVYQLVDALGDKYGFDSYSVWVYGGSLYGLTPPIANTSAAGLYASGKYVQYDWRN